MSESWNAAVPDVHLRLPRWMKVYGIFFSILWFGTLAVQIFFAATEEPLFVIVPLVMVVFGAFLIPRMFRIGVKSSSDELVLRNSFSTHTLQRAQIEGFRSGQWISPFHLVIYVSTPDEIHPLHITLHTPFFGKRRAQQQLAELRAWQAQGR